MVNCPFCTRNHNIVLKEWNYATFHVENFHCNSCNKNFKAYFYKDRKLSHIITNSTSSQTRMLSFVKQNSGVSEKEIAEAFNLVEDNVIRLLQQLERAGKIIPVG